MEEIVNEGQSAVCRGGGNFSASVSALLKSGSNLKMRWQSPFSILF